MPTNRAEVVSKVSQYVARVYGKADEVGFRAAFAGNDGNADGLLSLDEVSEILSKAGVGFRLTRWAIAKEIIDLLDADGDGQIQWSEFSSVFNG